MGRKGRVAFDVDVEGIRADGPYFFICQVGSGVGAEAGPGLEQVRAAEVEEDDVIGLDGLVVFFPGLDIGLRQQPLVLECF